MFANYFRLHPPFHFFLLPFAAAVLVISVINVIKHYETLEAWTLMLLGLMAPVAVLLIRINPLRAQDRVIRLEERMRLAAALNEPLKSRIGELTEPQLIALRFASDGELPGLVEKALSAKMPAKDIKKAIVSWRADIFRV
jgi:hypothetical protein